MLLERASRREKVGVEISQKTRGEKDEDEVHYRVGLLRLVVWVGMNQN